MRKPPANAVEETPAPPVELALLTYLRAKYPQRSPQRGEAFDQLRWRGGENAVIEHLEALYEAQNETR